MTRTRRGFELKVMMRRCLSPSSRIDRGVQPLLAVGRASLGRFGEAGSGAVARLPRGRWPRRARWIPDSGIRWQIDHQLEGPKAVFAGTAEYDGDLAAELAH